MIKTQVQIPDDLYRKAKAISKSRELSFAEVVRRGLEYVTSIYPDSDHQGRKWSLPTLPEKTFKKNIHKIDLRQFVADEESQRGMGHAGD